MTRRLNAKMYSRVLTVGLAAVSLSFAAACDSPGEGEGEGEGEVEGFDQEVLLNALEAAFEDCDIFNGLGQSDNGGTPLEELEPSAFGQQGDFDVRAFFEAQLELDGVSINDDNAADCVALLESCDPVLGEDGGACADLFEGARQDGEGCSASVQCESLNCGTDEDVCGVCVTPEPLIAEGEACDPEDDQCDFGLFCDGDVCVAFDEPDNLQAGDPCTEEEGCGGVFAGLGCVDGACAPIEVVQVGGDCQPLFGDNVTQHCIDSLSDNVCLDDDFDGQGVCTARAGVGESCAENFCVGGLSCNLDTELCEAGPGPGEPCDDVCGEGATCAENGVCVAFGNLGDACEADTCASGLVCDPASSQCALFADCAP
jgi:hypothetical protein